MEVTRVLDDRLKAINGEHGHEEHRIDEAETLEQERRRCLDVVVPEDEEGRDVADGSENAEQPDDHSAHDERVQLTGGCHRIPGGSITNASRVIYTRIDNGHVVGWSPNQMTRPVRFIHCCSIVK